MILHLQGEHSASDTFLDVFRKQFPNDNIVVRFCNLGSKILVISGAHEDYYDDTVSFAQKFDFSKISVVVVYYLNHMKEVFILKYIPPKIPVVWWMYGGDLYGRLRLKGYELFAPQTLPYVFHDKIGMIRRVKRFIYKIYMSYVDLRILKRIIGVIPCEKPDYELACSLFDRTVDHVDIYPRGEMPCYSMDNGNDICVGHSAALTVNHLYALDILKRVDIKGSSIILPLSYTIQSEEYRQAVVEGFRKEFGDKVCCLFDYQDLKTYEKGFLNYKVAIFPSWRQEALGNIFICFNLGVKVYLSIHNPCYAYFKDLGYFVYSLESIKCSDDLNPLTQKEKEHNRNIYNEVRRERNSIVPENLREYFLKYI